MARISFVGTDIDGNGKHRRLLVDVGEHLSPGDDDFAVPRQTIAEKDDLIVGPFTVMQLLEAIQIAVRT